MYQEGWNCWHSQKADYVSVIVDYGNYYRNLHESISKAQKSIFVLGWDIDSRIELLRGKDTQGIKETSFFDLICKRARENPDLQIYLNRWDYSMFFMRQREPLWKQKWKSCGLSNIHVCMDNVVPFSACHHQKIVVIDDTLAYWGGMDVALGRWDFRQHHVRNKNRADPAQLPQWDETEKFDPFHDIQAVMAGPAAHSLAQWARKRWIDACPSITPASFSPAIQSGLPDVWPNTDPPDFENIDVAIARTMPAMHGQNQVEEVYQLLLDEIGQAENFIYIENQFLACADIAHALNRRLKERPQLRLLAVSCFDPNGIMERLAMWGGRVRFKDILTEGGVADRTALTYPVCKENGHEAAVRIHSKLMIIDNKYLHIGSANINNRSMGMDTECDVSLSGSHEAARKKISAVRNDLIREHTGYSTEYIQNIVNCGDVKRLLIEKPTSRQHLREINDESFRDQPFGKLAYALADPRRPIIPAHWTRRPRWGQLKKARHLYYGIAFLSLTVILTAIWRYSPLAAYTDFDTLSAYLDTIRTAPFSLVWIILIYIAGGLAFFPVTAMSTAVVLLFGGIKGFSYATVGAIFAGLVGYIIGKWMGRERIIRIFPRAEKAMDKVRDSGIIGVTVIRMIPIAPYSLVNMVLGVTHVPITSFILGTALGLAPGKIMLAIFGESFINAFKQPNIENILLAGIGIAAWIFIVYFCNKLARGWQARREQMI